MPAPPTTRGRTAEKPPEGEGRAATGRMSSLYAAVLEAGSFEGHLLHARSFFEASKLMVGSGNLQRLAGKVTDCRLRC